MGIIRNLKDMRSENESFLQGRDPGALDGNRDKESHAVSAMKNFGDAAASVVSSFAPARSTVELLGALADGVGFAGTAVATIVGVVAVPVAAAAGIAALWPVAAVDTAQGAYHSAMALLAGEGKRKNG